MKYIIYWIMALIELLLLIITLLLFAAFTDSYFINRVAKNILVEYNISYDKIRGNLFTNMEIYNLEYQNMRVADKISIGYNPLSLVDGIINIRNLEIDGLNIDNLIYIIKSIPSSNSSSHTPLMDYSINRVKLRAKPFKYGGIKFKDLKISLYNSTLSRDFQITTKSSNISFNSDLLNLELNSSIRNRRLRVLLICL